MDKNERAEKQEKRKRSRKLKKVALITAASMALLGGGAFWLGHQHSSDGNTNVAYQSAQPNTPYTPEYQESYTPPGFDFGWLFGGFGKALSQSHSTMHWDTATKYNETLGWLALFIGGGVVFYVRSTKRKYLKFDNVGILISDARERESMSAKFIPWGCLEEVEVLNFDLDRDVKALGSAQAAAESSKAKVFFYVDDGNVVKVKWRDIVQCVEPGAFINSLKTYAPHACEKFEALAGDAHKVDKNSYTQLWFRYYSAGSERKRTSHLVAGDTLQNGRFEIAGQIGGGGQGTAYVAVDKNAATADGAPSEIVLKEYILPVHRGQTVMQATVDKLEHEAAILRKINHNNIVKLSDSFVEDHRGYLVMEYVHGKSLKEIVQQQGAQSEAAVIALAKQICDVLSYLHCQDPAIIHRDLTPDNLILQEDGTVKLVDFNVAHQLESAATATVVGKHCYIPPEQFRGKPTVQSDIYAFGCTLHFLLTGLEPEPLTCSKPRAFNEQVSEELSDIVAKATALDGAKRYANVAEMHDAIQALLGVKIRLPEVENATV